MIKNDNSAPTSTSSFNSLDLSEAQLTNLQQLGYEQMTAIQALALPLALSAQDLIVKAHTGSGKTLVFALAILQTLESSRIETQALVLCPTRELATQVAEVIRKVGRSHPSLKVSLICGGASISRQQASLAQGTHIIVGTPGRIEDLINRGAMQLSSVKTLIFDEADKMMDMGFYESLSTISNACPLKRQTLMFSATYSPALLERTEGFLINPRMIEAMDEPKPEIQQEFLFSQRQ